MNQIVDKFKFLTNLVALKHLEQELKQIQSNIDKLEARRKDLNKQKPADLKPVRQKLKFMVEHFDQLLLHQSNPLEKSRFFWLLFKKLTTYKVCLVEPPRTLNPIS